VIGLIIAALIGLTGIGGGTVMAPALIVFLGIPAAKAVGTALTFTAIVNLLVLPMYLWRGRVRFRIVRYMLLGGLPGVVLGGILLDRLSAHGGDHRRMYAALGAMIVAAAALNVYRLLRPSPPHKDGVHPRWLGLMMFPVGTETGFSSAGSGAFGSLAMMSMTELSATEIVGTGIAFVLVMTSVGSGIQVFAGNYDGGLLVKLLIGGAFGAIVGPLLALRIPSQPLKWGLAMWLALLGVQLLVRGLN
jgi:uncharacterized membrane protein YfcA